MLASSFCYTELRVKQLQIVNSTKYEISGNNSTGRCTVKLPQVECSGRSRVFWVSFLVVLRGGYCINPVVIH
jgi:hypothetical protein